MQFLFVHGVNTRREADGVYDRSVGDRDRRFRTVAFDGAEVTIANAYWGDDGADPGWGLACVPKSDEAWQRLGEPPAANLAQSRALLDAALVDFSSVVSGLSTVDLSRDEPADLVRRETFWAAAALYAELTPRPPWLAQMASDDAFLVRFDEEVEPYVQQAGLVRLGAGDRMRDLGRSILGVAARGLTGWLALGGRAFTPTVVIFIGDVFRYLKASDARERIRAAISEEIVAAALRANDDGTPLIVAGHSLGGVILYDILSDPQAVAALGERIGKPLEIDLLLTIGSQVSLFEELKLFTVSDEARGGGDRIARPAVAERWWNVFDQMDLVSFVASPVFDGVEDFAVDTVGGALTAHIAYFNSMVFYRRLNTRLKAAGLIA